MTKVHLQSSQSKRKRNLALTATALIGSCMVAIATIVPPQIEITALDAKSVVQGGHTIILKDEFGPTPSGLIVLGSVIDTVDVGGGNLTVNRLVAIDPSHGIEL